MTDPASRAEYNKSYYESRKEEMRQRARERYAQKIGRPVGKKGRPPGGTTYKQKWLELLERTKQENAQQEPIAQE